MMKGTQGWDVLDAQWLALKSNKGTLQDGLVMSTYGEKDFSYSGILGKVFHAEMVARDI